MEVGRGGCTVAQHQRHMPPSMYKSPSLMGGERKGGEAEGRGGALPRGNLGMTTFQTNSNVHILISS